MNRKIADQWCERGILFLTLAILVFGPLATGAVRMLEFLVIQGLTVGVLVLWIARLWLQRRWEFLWPPICWAVLAFTLSALVGIGRRTWNMWPARNCCGSWFTPFCSSPSSTICTARKRCGPSPTQWSFSRCPLVLRGVPVHYRIEPGLALRPLQTPRDGHYINPNHSPVSWN